MAMLEATLDLLEEGIAILDDQLKVVHWNQAAAALTGYTAQDVICRPCPGELYRVDQQHRDKVVASDEAELKAEMAAGSAGSSSPSPLQKRCNLPIHPCNASLW